MDWPPAAPPTTYSTQEKRDMLQRYTDQFPNSALPCFDIEKPYYGQAFFDEIKRALETGEPFRRSPPTLDKIR